MCAEMSLAARSIDSFAVWQALSETGHARKAAEVTCLCKLYGVVGAIQCSFSAVKAYLSFSARR